MLNLVSEGKLSPITADDLSYIADNMRPADVAEVWASGRNDPWQALVYSVKLSDWCRILTINGDILGVIGIVVEERLGGAGVPWFLGTDNVRKHAKTFVAISGTLVGILHTYAPLLVNYVHAENEDAIRYLEHIGFEVSRKAEKVGAGGEEFFKFSREFNRDSESEVCVTHSALL